MRWHRRLRRSTCQVQASDNIEAGRRWPLCHEGLNTLLHCFRCGRRFLGISYSKAFWHHHPSHEQPRCLSGSGFARRSANLHSDCRIPNCAAYCSETTLRGATLRAGVGEQITDRCWDYPRWDQSRIHLETVSISKSTLWQNLGRIEGSALWNLAICRGFTLSLLCPYCPSSGGYYRRRFAELQSENRNRKAGQTAWIRLAETVSVYQERRLETGAAVLRQMGL